MKKCGSCFRYIENWRDAKSKGLEPRYNNFAEYYYKPRKGIIPQGMGVDCPKEINKNYSACEYHEHRLIANIKKWYTFHFMWKLKDWYRDKVRVPLGGLRKPIALKWQDYYEGRFDRIIKSGEPICPRCKEMPYSTEQCVFCGQRFTEEDKQ